MATTYLLAYYIHIFLIGQCSPVRIDIPYETKAICEENAIVQLKAYNDAGHIGGYTICFPGLLKPGVPIREWKGSRE